jgi:hypothetical protein
MMEALELIIETTKARIARDLYAISLIESAANDPYVARAIELLHESVATARTFLVVCQQQLAQWTAHDLKNIY